MLIKITTIVQCTRMTANPLHTQTLALFNFRYFIRLSHFIKFNLRCKSFILTGICAIQQLVATPYSISVVIYQLYKFSNRISMDLIYNIILRLNIRCEKVM